MPASNAVPGFGAQFKLGNGASPEVFTALAEITEIPEFGWSQRIAEVTHLNSPGASEYIGLNLIDGNEFTLPMNFVADDTTQEDVLLERSKTGVAHNYQVLCSDASETTITFAAIISSVAFTHNTTAAASASVTFRPTGNFEIEQAA